MPFSVQPPKPPSTLSQLIDNSTHRLVTDDQIATWDAKGEGTVKSINNIPADSNGNVTITIPPTDNVGTSANRPIGPKIGYQYFDTTLGKPIWYKGSSTWVDATGATVTAVVDFTPPNDVTALATGTITSTSIILNWTNSVSSDVANYEIAYSSDSGTTYTVVSTIGTAGATYTVTGLTPSTNYTFRVIAIDTVGNRSTGATIASATISGLPVPTVSDDFTRADSTTSPGTSDSYNGGTNKVWTVWGSGGMGISTNRLYAPTGTGQAWVDSGLTDARMEITVTTVGNGHNFYFRVDSNGRYYRYAYNSSGWYLQEQNSTFATVATITGGPVLKANDVVAIEVQGTTCKLYVNNALVHTGTLADLLTNTGFGIGFTSTPIGYVDNFNIYSLAPANNGSGGTTPPPTTTYTKPTAYLSVADYGATGTDSTDVTTNIQNCINAAKTQGVAVVFPAGTYWINLSKGLAIPSNMTIWGDMGATVKGITSSLTSYQMFRLWSVSNVNIIGYLTIVGDKAARPANTSSEGGMGISVANASNINIDGVNVSQCMGDGIYLGEYSGTPAYNKTLKITNSTFDSNNRQGMSVISAIDLTVDNCTFSNTGGNPAGPSAGVDFEPNKATHYQQNLNFTNCKFINNVGHGVWGDLYYMNTSGHPISITVSNSTVSGNQGLIYGTPGMQSQIATRSTVAGYIKVNGAYIYNK